MMPGLYAKNFFGWGRDDYSQIDTAKGATAIIDVHGRSTNGYLAGVYPGEICLFWVEAFTMFFLEPESVTEFHNGYSFL